MMDAAGADWLRDLDPRLRIVQTCLFALATAGLTHWQPSLGALVLALALTAVSRIDRGELLRGLAALEAIMLALLVTLPFSVPGAPVLQIGPLAISDAGLAAAAIIALKANAIVLVMLVMVGTLEPARFGHALARLGVPDKLVHLLLMTSRQIHIMNDEYERLTLAMRARAFVPRANRHTWRTYSYLMGMMLVRSMRRSKRVLAAMRCRGFTGKLHLLTTTTWRRADGAFAAGFAVPLMILIAWDRWP